MSNDHILDQEIRILGRGEYSRRFYYPSTCQNLRKMFKPIIASKYPEEKKFTLSRISKRHNEYIPFLNERDQMGRLIPATKESTQLSLIAMSNQESMQMEIPIKDSDAGAESNTENTSFKLSRKRHSQSSSLFKGNLMAKARRDPSRPESVANSQASHSQSFKQNSILPLLVTDSPAEQEVSQVIGFGGKLKYRQTIHEKLFSMQFVNSSYLGEEVKDKLSPYFRSPERKDVYAEASRNISNPSVGYYEPKDDFMRSRTRNISFGSLPKFYDPVNSNKKVHEYDLDFQKSFENTQEKSHLVPNFAKQSERITEFGSKKKDGDDGQNLKAPEKTFLGAKGQTRKNDAMVKELEEVKKRRNLSYHLNEKFNPMDHRDFEETIRALKVKYKLRVGFKIR